MLTSNLLLMIIPAIVIVVGVVLWNRGSHLLKNGKRATATIIESTVHSSRDDGRTYYYIVRFLTDKQEWIIKKLNEGYTRARKNGTQIEVVYDPDEPTNVSINSVFMLAILPRLLVGGGVVAFIGGILIYLGVIDSHF